VVQYRAEDVDVASIEFINNQPCVDLIEKGILPKLDDMNMSTWETTDVQFLDQIVRQFTSNAYFGMEWSEQNQQTPDVQRSSIADQRVMWHLRRCHLQASRS
jgi:myosin heavy subunit